MTPANELRFCASIMKDGVTLTPKGGNDLASRIIAIAADDECDGRQFRIAAH